MKTRNLSIVIYTLILLLSTFSSKAGVGDNDKNKWSKKIKEKKLNNLRNKFDSSNTAYPHPFLTIHLGASYITNTGNIQLNSGQIPGTKINGNDLGFPKVTIFPRVNAVLNFGNLGGVAFDTYNTGRRGDIITNKDIKFGDTTFLSGSHLKTKLSLNYVSLSYINFFHKRDRGRIGFLVGATGIFYNLKITNTTFADFSEKKSIFVPLPTIGLNGSIYLRKNLFFRAVIKYSGWWSKNYNCNVLNINPYFEYYIYKNFGVGMRYNFGYANFKNLPDKKFDGSITNTLSAISAVFVYRFVKKS